MLPFNLMVVVKCPRSTHSNMYGGRDVCVYLCVRGSRSFAYVMHLIHVIEHPGAEALWFYSIGQLILRCLQQSVDCMELIMTGAPSSARFKWHSNHEHPNLESVDLSIVPYRHPSIGAQ